MAGLGVVAVGLFSAAGWMATRPMAPADSAGEPRGGSPDGTLPHVVIVLIDTLRADRLGVYGYPAPTSPNIDALAAESVVFEQANAPAPWTLPSVTSLLTSTFVCQHGVTVDGQKIGPELTPLAQRLQGLGYATASFYANAYAGPMTGLDRGYDLVRSVRFVTGANVDAWLTTVPAKPVFLYLHNIEPHNPYDVPDTFVTLFGTISAETKQRVGRAYVHYRKLTRADYGAKRPVGTTDNTEQQDAALAQLAAMKGSIDVLYDAAVRLADQRVGRIVQALKRRGLWDNTLFMLMSDHGEELGDRGGWQHDQSVYQELIHVPLIVHLPGGRSAGLRVAQTVSLVDVVPTILDLIGRPDLANDCSGVSLGPLLSGEPPNRPEPIAITAMRLNVKKYYRPYAESRGNINLVLRRGRFKGIFNAEPDTLELYDLQADPGERVDLSPSQPSQAESFRQAAQQWLTGCIPGSQQQTAPGPDKLDEKTLQNLRSLGYVD